MDPVIRAALIDSERRRLVRRQALPAAPAHPQETSAGASVDNDPLAAQAHEMDRLRLELERQLESTRRQFDAEREQLRENAAAAKDQATREAAERGYQEGYRKGEEAGSARFDEEAERLRALARSLSSVRQAVLDDAEDMLVEVAYAAICRMAGAATVKREIVVHALRGVASEAASENVLRIAVHEDDASWVRELLKTSVHVEVTASPSVDLGGCTIGSRSGTLDARLETQLEHLRLALVEARRAQATGERQ